MSESEIDLPEYWPRQGERLFVPGSPGRDAEIAENQAERIYRLKEAFKKAADLMVARTREDAHEQGDLVWPIVFCYRQYLELALKDIIARHGGQVEPTIEPIWNTHYLGDLWKSCKRIMGHTLIHVTTDEMPEILAMEAFISEFERIDARSYAFRYPKDRKGCPIEIPIDSIDLVHLQRVMEGVYAFLDCNESALGAHFDGLP